MVQVQLDSLGRAGLPQATLGWGQAQCHPPLPDPLIGCVWASVGPWICREFRERRVVSHGAAVTCVGERMEETSARVTLGR